MLRGWVETSALDAYDDALKARIRTWKAKVPLQRFATEAEISSAVVYLLYRPRSLFHHRIGSARRWRSSQRPAMVAAVSLRFGEISMAFIGRALPRSSPISPTCHEADSRT